MLRIALDGSYKVRNEVSPALVDVFYLCPCRGVFFILGKDVVVFSHNPEEAAEHNHRDDNQSDKSLFHDCI